MEMKHKISFHGIGLSYSDGFHILDEEEYSRLEFLGEGDRICLSDPDRHMLVSIGWKQAGSVVSHLIGTKDLAKDMERKVRRPMKQYGYHMSGFLKKRFGGKEAMGFFYEYTIQGTDMTGESYVIKTGKEIYSFHVYMRTELKSGSIPVWKELLESISLE